MEFLSILFGSNYNASRWNGIPALYVFKTTNLEMHLQLPSRARKAMKTYKDAKIEAMDKPKRKAKQKNDMYI